MINNGIRNKSQRAAAGGTNTLIRKLDGLVDTARRERKPGADRSRRPVEVCHSGPRAAKRQSAQTIQHPKISGKPRAPKGSGTVVATYKPGNLRKSVQTLRFRRPKPYS